ncbi:MAG: FAD-dependent oxidoreductase, partial [Candidatus Thermoplasmatota archaeon]|nr:FAD-dependent oxidoreductase [Candidatus Thermoplasmatota archaeon]
GVEIKTNTKIESITSLKGYDAVFVAIGAHKSRKLKIPGEELQGVLHGIIFLRDLNLNKKVKVGSKVVVIGGGNVAIDSARSALRLGAKEVFILYRRSRAEMPANEWEILEAEEEGVRINYLVAPTKIIGKDGKVVGLECIRMELGEPDETGRRKPVPIKGSEFIIDADMIIPAIGQETEINFLKANNFELTKKGTLSVDSNTLATNLKGIFAGGDLVRGPSTVVEAIADGYQAAVSIDKYLKGESLELKREEKHVVGIEEVDIKAVPKKARVKQLQLPAQERIKNFAEVNLGFTEQQAIEESKRCLNCAGCSECKECEKACEPKAIIYEQKEEILELEVGAIIVATGFEPYLPYELTEYGYGRYPDVLTALEYERILSASGPTEGKIIKRSNKKKPKTIAFIQCVGSRDMQHDHPYCCAVCCMHATKEAMITKEHEKDIDCWVFYTDLRALSKGFQEYVDRAKNEYGIKYIRAKPGRITGNGGSALRVWYEDTVTSELRTLNAELVVLATTLLPREDVREIASILGVELNEYGFFRIPNPLDAPVDTTREGIFVAGYCEAPKDIPESVAQGSAAAARAAEIIMRR